MSTSEYLYFSGSAKWPRLVKPDEKYGKWSVNVYLDKKSLALFKECGIQVEPKSDDDGEYVTFRRDTEKLIAGKLVAFEPPEVMDKDGKALDGFKVGNGSKITAKVQLFPTKKGKGHRLLAVRVDELVAYEGSGDSDNRF